MQHIILFYKYIELSSVQDIKSQQEKLCKELELLGRILLSNEGINATLSGTKEHIAAYMSAMCADSSFQMNMDDFKQSVHENANTLPFSQLQIKIVPEIVSTGGVVAFPSPHATDAEHGYLTPEEFHQAMEQRDENTVILDVRNHKEYLIGHFEDAVDPKVRTFSEYYSFLAKQLPQFQDKKVLMYCTGGIRCEKASKYLMEQGIQDVHHLKGGIHKYLEKYPQGGHYQGKNFVFDTRINMSSNDATIVGKCIDCQAPWDQFHGKWVCTVCRDLVLVCPQCQTREQPEFHCDQHRYLKECYFTFLQYFSTAELRQQYDKLQLLLQAHQHDPSWKKKRQTLRKQLDKIQAVLDQNQPAAPRPSNFPCRTCMSSDCTGNCWGFFA